MIDKVLFGLMFICAALGSLFCILGLFICAFHIFHILGVI